MDLVAIEAVLGREAYRLAASVPKEFGDVAHDRLEEGLQAIYTMVYTLAKCSR